MKVMWKDVEGFLLLICSVKVKVMYVLWLILVHISDHNEMITDLCFEELKNIF